MNMQMRKYKIAISMDVSFPYKILNETAVKNFKPDESFCPIISSKRGTWERYQHTILEH